MCRCVLKKLVGLFKISESVTLLLLMRCPGTTVQRFTYKQEYYRAVHQGSMHAWKSWTFAPWNSAMGQSRSEQPQTSDIFTTKLMLLWDLLNLAKYGKIWCHLGNAPTAQWPLLPLPKEAAGTNCPSCSPSGGPPFSLLSLEVKLLCSETYD